jgi:hypothetical protein
MLGATRSTQIQQNYYQFHFCKISNVPHSTFVTLVVNSASVIRGGVMPVQISTILKEKLMKNAAIIILLLVMVPALALFYSGNAAAQTKPPVPVIVNMMVPQSLLIPPAATVVYTVPAGKSFTFESVALFNTTAPGAVPVDLNNITLQITTTVAGVRTVTPIFTTVLRADAAFSIYLGIPMVAGDTVEVVNGSGALGGPFSILATGRIF